MLIPMLISTLYGGVLIYQGTHLVGAELNKHKTIYINKILQQKEGFKLLNVECLIFSLLCDSSVTKGVPYLRHNQKTKEK